MQTSHLGHTRFMYFDPTAYILYCAPIGLNSLNCCIIDLQILVTTPSHHRTWNKWKDLCNLKKVSFLFLQIPYRLYMQTKFGSTRPWCASKWEPKSRSFLVRFIYTFWSSFLFTNLAVRFSKSCWTMYLFQCNFKLFFNVELLKIRGIFCPIFFELQQNGNWTDNIQSLFHLPV